MLPEIVKPVAEFCAAAVELVGITMLALLAIAVVVIGAARLAAGRSSHEVWEQTREQLGRAILLGLEFLVAADIIHTVAVELTYETVTVLAIIVAIRTFLSFTLEVELTGRWPWQSGATDPAGT